ncbi:MAG: methionine/alanine import family NSS transporter small subunit [Anaerovoracaceae bacterium]|nr:methionine/alanine import family NSS transporter small subunit [Anaerovoracaceae bacterium]
MSTSAIIMMIIGCVGLWGGFAVSCAISFKCSKKGNNK